MIIHDSTQVVHATIDKIVLSFDCLCEVLEY